MSKARYGDESGRKIRDYADPKIGDVLDRIDVFPTHLSLDDQGLFVLGYYHQNKANYPKKEKAEKEKSND
jgi:CRISPR-associated protein Csd1